MTKKKGKAKGKSGTHSKVQRSKNGSQQAESNENKTLERTKRNKLKKERRLKECHGDYSDDDFVQLRRQLDLQGFKLREIQGDGYCNFYLMISI